MKKILVLIILVGIVVVVCIIRFKTGPTSITSDQAIGLVQKKYPEYEGYPSSNLPPKRIETINVNGDWLVGMYIEGSGVKGILKANCFSVSKLGIVTETGLFQGEGPAKSINLVTCVPRE